MSTLLSPGELAELLISSIRIQGRSATISSLFNDFLQTAPETPAAVPNRPLRTLTTGLPRFIEEGSAPTLDTVRTLIGLAPWSKIPRSYRVELFEVITRAAQKRLQSKPSDEVRQSIALVLEEIARASP